MYQALIPGAVGVKAAGLAAQATLAHEAGFQGLDFDTAEVADLIDAHGIAYVTDIFAHAGLKPSGWGLPVDWRGDEEAWKRDMAQLPRRAAASQKIGCRRVSTWIMPCSDERELEANREFHIQRFKPIASLLADYDIGLGLEFIGPKTARDSQKYPFIYTMADMLAMGREIGPNVGLLLDCFHWYTSHGTKEDLLALKPEQVVFVHVNDAPAGVPTDEQQDGKRGLPGETGAIDIATFLQSLKAIGYEGPVAAEPFKAELNDLPTDEERLRIVKASMDEIWQTARL